MTLAQVMFGQAFLGGVVCAILLGCWLISRREDRAKWGECEQSTVNAKSEETMREDTGCICQGNWRRIIAETEPLLEKRFKNADGEEYLLFGVVHGEDDYYYGLCGVGADKGKLKLLSCVENLEGHGFTPLVN